MSKKSKKKSDYEVTNLNPGWIKTLIPQNFIENNLNRIIWFYVIHTICTGLSANGISINEYGWDKNVWIRGKLKENLYSICNLEKNKNLCKAENQQDMKNACEICKLKKNFCKIRDEERIAFVKAKNYNEVLSIFYHIRNALAHGRIAIMENSQKEIVYFLEDGKKKNEKFIVTARMVLKEKTLISWIDIIENNKRNIDK
jgi:hypothetical protein